MRKVIVIDLHLIEVISIANIEKTAINDESVVIVTASYRLFNFVKYSSIDGQFRFTWQQWIIQNEIVDSLIDGHHPKIPSFGTFYLFTYLLDFKFDSFDLACTHLNIEEKKLIIWIVSSLNKIDINASIKATKSF